MKTKTISFDLETAKKIQAGEIKGKIKTRGGKDVRVICWDRMGVSSPIVTLVREANCERIIHYLNKGVLSDMENPCDLVLEVPDNEPQFKPFDKVLMRDEDYEMWVCDLFSYYDHRNKVFPYTGVSTISRKQCIPYEGNEHLVGTTNKPKED